MGFTEQNGTLTFTPSPDGQPPKSGKSWVGRHKVATAALVVVGIFGVAAATGGGSTPEDVAQKSPASQSSTSDAPLTNRQKADKAADAVDNARVTQYGQELYIRFPIQDNLTDGLRRAGVASDTFTLLKALKNHDVDFDTVTIVGTFDMQDKFGDDLPDQNVFNADFDHATVNRIRYENIATTELDVLEGFVKGGLIYLHPAFGWQR